MYKIDDIIFVKNQVTGEHGTYKFISMIDSTRMELMKIMGHPMWSNYWTPPAGWFKGQSPPGFTHKLCRTYNSKLGKILYK